MLPKEQDSFKSSNAWPPPNPPIPFSSSEVCANLTPLHKIRPFRVGKFLVDSGSPVTIVPIITSERNLPAQDSGLLSANGNPILMYGSTDIIVPILGKSYAFRAMKCDVVRPILGRDFFDGPGRNLILDVANRTFIHRISGERISVSADDEIVCALPTSSSSLCVEAPPFQPKSSLISSRDVASLKLKDYSNSIALQPKGNFPSLFSPIRIETGDNPPVYSKSRPLSGEKADFVTKKINELIGNGILEEVDGPVQWASPITVAAKKGPDGSIK
ncbi:Transposon Ty3-G Gag-Pol poly, partial [Paramuricea clavata]